MIIINTIVKNIISLVNSNIGDNNVHIVITVSVLQQPKNMFIAKGS